MKSGTEQVRLEEEKYYVEVARTIKQQIMDLDFWALARWGAKNYVAVPRLSISDLGIDVKYSGLQFDVRGGKFKGRVFVLLNGGDLYNVYYVKIGDIRTRYRVTFHKQVLDVFAEDLPRELESTIG